MLSEGVSYVTTESVVASEPAASAAALRLYEHRDVSGNVIFHFNGGPTPTLLFLSLVQPTRLFVSTPALFSRCQRRRKTRRRR